MSIWRSISCKNCEGSIFDIADNGLDNQIRLICSNCEAEFFLECKEIKLAESLK